MKSLIILLSLLLIQSVCSAQFEYEITSSPDSATVLLNGEKKCKTPCKVRFFWRDAINGKLSFAVEEKGYKSWHDTLFSKPAYLDLKEDVNLDRKLPVFEFDSLSVLIAYDKLVADFKEGRKIGEFKNSDGQVEDLKWEGSIKFGSEDFEARFYDIVSNVGFTTPLSESAILFSDKSDEIKRVPRYVVGIQLIDYEVKLVDKGSSFFEVMDLAGRTSMKLKWQVFDNAIDEIVLTDTTVGVSRYRKNIQTPNPDNLLAFEDGLIKFLEKGELTELVKNADQLIPGKPDSSNLANRKIDIPQIEAKDFESQSEMIQYASEACVTVLTDGGHGSGVIIDSEGLVMTAYHVIAGVNRIQVKFSNGLTLDAEVIAIDNDFDVALLDVSGSGFKALPINLSSEVGLGQELITIGTPADVDLGQSIAKGLLSGKRKIEGKVFMQLDLAVSPGNSGGPLLNKKGEIEGIVLRKIVGAGVEGIGFGVPIKDALKALNISVVSE